MLCSRRSLNITAWIVSPDPTSNVIVLLSMVMMKTWIGVLAGVDVVFDVDVTGKIVLVGTWSVFNKLVKETEIESLALEVVVR